MQTEGRIVSELDDREEYVQGPPPGYVPPPAEELQDPEFKKRQSLRGRDLVLDALASNGLRKVDGKWVRDEE
jgi:hypothetical protein